MSVKCSDQFAKNSTFHNSEVCNSINFLLSDSFFSSLSILTFLEKEVDLDPYALEYSNKRLSVHLNSFSLYHANYMKFPEIINSLGIGKLNGMLFDLGTSSYQVDSKHRGFSYMKESDLDMRFNYNDGITAKDFLNSTDIADGDLHVRHGELAHARRAHPSLLAAHGWVCVGERRLCRGDVHDAGFHF